MAPTNRDEKKLVTEICCANRAAESGNGRPTKFEVLQMVEHALSNPPSATQGILCKAEQKEQ